MKLKINKLNKGKLRINVYLTIQDVKKLDQVTAEINKTQHFKINRSKLIAWLIQEYLQDPYILLVQQKKEKIKEINAMDRRLNEIENKRNMSKEEIEEIKTKIVSI